MTYWRAVAKCMRQHGVSRFPNPTTSVPPHLHDIREVSDRDGAILVIPTTINMQSAVFAQAAGSCGFFADSSKQVAQENTQRTRCGKSC